MDKAASRIRLPLLECKRGTIEELKGYIGMAKGVRLKKGMASGDKQSIKNHSAKL